MGARIDEILSLRTGAERGALTAAAGALLLLLLAALAPPDRLVSLVGPPPFSQALALIASAAAITMGAEVGRRAAKYRAPHLRRVAVLTLWSFLGYLASVVVAVDLLVLLDEGPGPLAEPFLLLVRGLVVCLLLLPWAAGPVALTALALERWTRTVPPRPGSGGPGGPKGGTRLPRPDEEEEQRRGAA